MKKLIVSAVIASFAVAVYAGDCSQGSSCCSKAKEQTKTSTCTEMTKTSGCCSEGGKAVAKSNKKETTPKQALKSPKAMSLASR